MAKIHTVSRRKAITILSGEQRNELMKTKILESIELKEKEWQSSSMGPTKKRIAQYFDIFDPELTERCSFQLAENCKYFIKCYATTHELKEYEVMQLIFDLGLLSLPAR